VLSDLHVLDLTTLTWRTAPAMRPELPPRCRHSLAVAPAQPAPPAGSEHLSATDHTAPPSASPQPPAALEQDALAADLSSLCVGNSAAATAGSPADSGTSAAAGEPNTNSNGPAEAGAAEAQHEAWLYGGFDGSETRGDMFCFLLPAGLGCEAAASSSADAQVSTVDKHRACIAQLADTCLRMQTGIVSLQVVC